MELDPRVLPDPQPAGEPTPQSAPADNQPKPDILAEKEAELEALKIKNLELQKQKEHWREKYERDIPASPEPEDDLSQEIKTLKEEVSSLKQEKEKERVHSKYPQLKDKEEEFKEFLESSDNKGLKLEKAAQLFLLENGMLENIPQRKGLEKPTGGSKITTPSGISQEDVKRLRETQPRKYVEMLRKGTLKPEDIK